MKTFEFSKDSWHYKVVDTWDSRLTRWTADVDICTYTRALMLALAVYGLIAGFLILGIGVNMYSIANLFSYMFLGYILDPSTKIVLAAECAMGAFVSFIFWNENRKLHKIENPSEPGFIELAYRGWKDKFCARIEFK